MTGAHGPTGPKDAISVQFNRNGATLESVDVTVTDREKAGIQLEVFWGSPGSFGPNVYRGWVSAADTSSGTWSGTLSPSDWKGGCQDGVYWIGVDVDLGPGFDVDFKSEQFSCSGR